MYLRAANQTPKSPNCASRSRNRSATKPLTSAIPYPSRERRAIKRTIACPRRGTTSLQTAYRMQKSPKNAPRFRDRNAKRPWINAIHSPAPAPSPSQLSRTRKSLQLRNLPSGKSKRPAVTHRTTATSAPRKLLDPKSTRTCANPPSKPAVPAPMATRPTNGLGHPHRICRTLHVAGTRTLLVPIQQRVPQLIKLQNNSRVLRLLFHVTTLLLGPPYHATPAFMAKREISFQGDQDRVMVCQAREKPKALEGRMSLEFFGPCI